MFGLTDYLKYMTQSRGFSRDLLEEIWTPSDHGPYTKGSSKDDISPQFDRSRFGTISSDHLSVEGSYRAVQALKLAHEPLSHFKVN